MTWRQTILVCMVIVAVQIGIEWATGSILASIVFTLALAAIVVLLPDRIYAALGERLDQAPTPSIERWLWVGLWFWVAVIIAKGAWNIRNDPPGVVRPCVFCTPYVPYQPEPLPPELQQ